MYKYVKFCLILFFSYVFLKMSVKVTNERIDHAILGPGKSGTELFVKMHPNIDVVKMKEQTQYFNVTFDLLVYTGSHGSWNNLQAGPSGIIILFYFIFIFSYLYIIFDRYDYDVTIVYCQLAFYSISEAFGKLCSSIL